MIKTLEQLNTELEATMEQVITRFQKTIKNMSRKSFILPAGVTAITVAIIVGCILMMVLADMYIAPLIIQVATTACAPFIIKAIKSEQEDLDERIALLFENYSKDIDEIYAAYDTTFDKISIYNIYLNNSYLEEWVLSPLRNRYKNDDEFLTKLAEYHHTCINDNSNTKTCTEWLAEFLK